MSAESFLINMKIMAKSLHKNALKQAKQKEMAEKAAEKFCRQGKMEMFSLQSDKREFFKREEENFERMSYQWDMMATRFQSQLAQKQLGKQMGQFAKMLEKTAVHADAEKAEQLMEKLKNQMEDVEIISQSYGSMTNGVQAQSIGAQGQSDVEAFKKKIMDKVGVEFREDMENVPPTMIQEDGYEQKNVEDGLGDRLRALRAE